MRDGADGASGRNASYTDKGVAQHKSAHVSVAVAIPGGLITPVVRDAQTKGLAQIAAEMKDLAARARDKKLKPQEYMGGTFSISNLGMIGIRQFASIINPPEGMILSVGAGEKRAVVKDDKVVVATMMTRDADLRSPRRRRREGARWLATLQAVRRDAGGDAAVMSLRLRIVIAVMALGLSRVRR